jgi:hypothetical protein
MLSDTINQEKTLPTKVLILSTVSISFCITDPFENQPPGPLTSPSPPSLGERGRVRGSGRMANR